MLKKWLMLGLLGVFVAESLGTEIDSCSWRGETVGHFKDLVILKLENNSDLSDIQGTLSHFGASVTWSDSDSVFYSIKLNTKEVFTNVLDSLNNHNDIKYAEPSFPGHLGTAPNDPDFGDQWYLHNIGQSPYLGTSDADIDMLEAWGIETEFDNVVLSICDSGIPWEYSTQSLTHSDLDDASRYILGIDAVYPPDPVYTDFLGHGTKVAGLAAAETNNNTDLAGMTWDGKTLINIITASFMAEVRVEWVISAIRHSIAYGESQEADLVLNFSFGFFAYSQALHDVMIEAHDAGALAIVCTGNEGSERMWYPARFASRCYRT